MQVRTFAAPVASSGTFSTPAMDTYSINTTHPLDPITWSSTASNSIYLSASDLDS